MERVVRDGPCPDRVGTLRQDRLKAELRRGADFGDKSARFESGRGATVDADGAESRPYCAQGQKSLAPLAELVSPFRA